ncbi:MAG TPA: SpoIIE family protein phosphatase [Rudaea sp.]|nr:SpoIIE family protein phosphatase [Rudaea sp.]
MLHRILHPNTARRLGSWVLLGSVCVLAASLAFVVFKAQSAVRAQRGESLTALANASASAVAARTVGVEMAARVVAAAIGRRLDNPDFIEDMLADTVVAHADIGGVAAAFEPDAVAQVRSLYAPFYTRKGDATVRRDLAEDSTPYREAPWYRHASGCERGCWGEIFQSQSRGETMINYGVPIRDATKRIVGVVNVDVRQRWLQSVVDSARPSPASFAFLLSETGQTLADAKPERVGTPIFEWARKAGAPEVTATAQRMLAGETGATEYFSPTLGIPVRTFFTPVPGSRWSLGIVVPYSTYVRDSQRLFFIAVAVGSAGLAALGLFVFLSVRRLLAPLAQLAVSADHIARGELDFRLDPPRRADEVGRLTQSFVRMRDELKQHIGELTEATGARERLQSELEIAQHIQESMLPKNHYVGAGAYPFELNALLSPARVVGGDLYSYVVRRDGRLCFLIGDVAGKGIPAALFMARTITSANSRATAIEQPEQLLRQLNADLCAGNDDCMFVTLLCGVLDVASGRLMLASAGHDAPIRVGEGGATRIELETGSPLGLYPDATFPSAQAQLAPGELIVLYTDGITEAFDPDGALYGEQRLFDILAQCDRLSPAGVIEAIVADVAAYTRDAAPADDLTLLVLHWRGASAPERSLTFEIGAELAQVGTLLGRIEEWLLLHAINAELRCDVRVALEELLVNAVEYGFPHGAERARLRTMLTLDAGTLHVELTDNGIAYDPFSRPPPNLDIDHDDRDPGGLGVFLVTQLASEYHYRRAGERNRIDLSFHAPPILQPGEWTHEPASPD